MTALMSLDLHQICIIGTYSQGQHNLVTSRLQGQGQSNEGHFCFVCQICTFWHKPPTVLVGECWKGSDIFLYVHLYPLGLSWLGQIHGIGIRSL